MTLQNLSQLGLLVGSQARREVDLVLDHKISPLTWLLGERHAKAGIPFLTAWLRGTRLVKAELLAVNRSHLALPASKGFLELQNHSLGKVVIFSLVQRVGFL